MAHFELKYQLNKCVFKGREEYLDTPTFTQKVVSYLDTPTFTQKVVSFYCIICVQVVGLYHIIGGTMNRNFCQHFAAWVFGWCSKFNAR